MHGFQPDALNTAIITITLKHELRVSVTALADTMKNVTISMEDELYRATRVKAAEIGLSLSGYLALAAKEFNANRETDALEEARQKRRAAINAILNGPMWDVMDNGRMPTADERNARR
jgi:hypothetical protein